MLPVESPTVWLASPEFVPSALWPHLRHLLDPEEQARADRFVRKESRAQYVAAHALLRLMLSVFSGCRIAPDLWRFATGSNGKPFVAGGDLEFNLSHCDAIVACAIDRRGPLGVDVEYVCDRSYADIIPWFSKSERVWIDALPPEKRSLGIVRLWTLKEAALKASGLGLSLSMDKFAIDVEALAVTVSPPCDDLMRWRLHQRIVGSHCVMALAWSKASGADTPSVRLISSRDWAALLAYR